MRLVSYKIPTFLGLVEDYPQIFLKSRKMKDLTPAYLERSITMNTSTIKSPSSTVIESAFLKRALKPYLENAIYVKKATLLFHKKAGEPYAI
uniref:Uncharacterized protein n=1 Tax=Candidatus Kentrum eta TaxID=2126337 RepID=A0A450UGS4_9GAMM|nr:MAG: hypothetical protein BECKH772A_GA0070896_100344 [Candidatus Kentron sp. H]VFJ92930.1 MAG: hypothetical protein BECKH772B_GA0070898_100364 [Candidatus Kentron sp. H]VFJ99544.1 MAG: hypothetical protein BECKH772C_GA0070978_100334 [Candidatus Kentron sp. H]